MKANLNLGKYFGTQVQIHWTFFVLITWIILSEIFSGASMDRILFNFQFVIAVMICVLLHEIGHSFVAKRYGFKTKKMVLMPIGGISTLDKTIESSKKEIAISFAGILVNVIIAIILFFAIPVTDYISFNLGDYFTALNDFSFKTFLFFLFIANVVLVLINLIPAFPLDGGRILRALLNLKFNRVQATSITATISHIIAILFLLIGVLFNPVLVFLSLFIFIGSFSENRMVTQLGLLKGHKVRDAMLEAITVFSPEDTMDAIIKVIISGSETNFVVLKDTEIVGLLYHEAIIENSDKRTLLVKDLMTTSFKTLQADEKLSKAFGIMNNEMHPFFPVMDKDKFVGAIDFANMNEFLLMEAKLHS